ncbi:wax ester/triacylglycerol synthase family O-acyltransferase [Streptomyces sp. A7024]|uniref:Diacylglycerol O-acyltransferase n=1 Tax=Streptomyces coryli TaxID=1128680 RepID=A0A6G4TT68_9ACTN|nr:wax ester/triacylglycerol synthase family O-acyltransferase [Streptomyces coryli]NGN62298.1 wax ester/triacylglycerol synthase family O-acyltransferase [Streptomyces coryli]
MTAAPLAPLDLAFWTLESVAHPMHMGALGVFTGAAPEAPGRAAGLLTERAEDVPGLGMRIRSVRIPMGAAVREPDPDFDPLDHVHLTAATKDFHATAGEIMAAPLDRRRPPWEAHVLPAADGTSFAVLFKFHHALADGLGALMLACGIMDPDPAAEPRAPRPVRQQPSSRWPLPGPNPLQLPGAVRRRAEEAGRALGIAASVVGATLEIRTSPSLTAAASGTRRTAGAVLDLDTVNRVRKQTGGTVNDLLIALVAGALRRWLDERGAAVDDVVPRALIPVSRRRPRTARPQGNQLSGYLLRLPVAEPDPLARVRRIRADMDRNKQAGSDRGAGAVALLAEQVPPLGHRLAGPVLAQAARLLFDLMITSVPLPSLGMKLAGCPLAEVYPFAPLAHGQTLAVAVSTYRGKVHYGLIADGEAAPDLDRLAAALGAELDALTTAVEQDPAVR